MVWRSRLHFVFIFMVGLTLLIGLDSSVLLNTKEPNATINEAVQSGIMLLLTLSLFYWLYLQRWHVPALKGYSLGEFFMNICLNTMVVLITLLPILPIEVALRSGGAGFIEGVAVICFLLIYIPIIFLSFIIRYYSITRIVVILLALLVYASVFVSVSAFLVLEEDTLATLILLQFIGLMVYICVKLQRQKYSRFDQGVIFVQILMAPIAVLMLLSILRDDTMAMEYDFMGFIMPATVLSYLVLFFFTRFVTKAMQKPIVV